MNRVFAFIVLGVIFCAVLVLANVVRGGLITVEAVTAARDAAALQLTDRGPR